MFILYYAFASFYRASSREVRSHSSSLHELDLDASSFNSRSSPPIVLQIKRLDSILRSGIYTNYGVSLTRYELGGKEELRLTSFFSFLLAPGNALGIELDPGLPSTTSLHRTNRTSYRR